MFYPLKIAQIDKPIDSASTLTFELPQHLYDKFNYQPGQHLIIELTINKETVRRTYSLNSCPFNEEAIQVTVKRVKDGLVSNYINDQLKVGDSLSVMPPQGRFFADIQPEDYKSYFLFAAGSGITPILSILKSVLEVTKYSTVNLLYGNSNQNSIIFKDELAELQKKYPQRLNIVHTLSDPKVWTSWESWKGKTGRINTALVEWFVNEHPPVAQNTEYYICGPGVMNTNVQTTLVNLGIPKQHIFIEQFGGKIEEINVDIVAFENAELAITLNDKNHQLQIKKGQTILQALKAANLEPPYSCESGVCGTCVAQLKQGKAEMKSCMALTDEDIEKGYVLTCQALPVSEKVALEF